MVYFPTRISTNSKARILIIRKKGLKVAGVVTVIAAAVALAVPAVKSQGEGNL